MEEKKNNNALYTTLVIVALLLILLPFFIFDASGYGLKHFLRFGLHALSFAAAVLAGALFSGAITSAASSSVAGMKIAIWTGITVLTGGIAYNAVQYIQSNPTPTNASLVIKDSINTASTPMEDIDSISVSSKENISSSTDAAVNNTPGSNPEENKKAVDQTIPGAEKKTTTVVENKTTNPSDQKKNTYKKTTSTTTTPVNTTNNNNQLAEQCNSFQVLQGNKLLDRKLGLSIYDPNKIIRFNNDCGCVLKEANMAVRRDGKIIEEKSQSGNYVNWRGFKDINIGDKLEIEIKQANCKDSKGALYLYAFPKPILTIIYISDHMEFEGSDKKTTTTQKTPAKTFEKDKVEEEYNKY